MMYLAIDVGTHAVRAGIFDEHGNIHFLNELPLSIDRLHNPSRVEQNPVQLRDALVAVVTYSLQGFNKAFKGQHLVAGLACQRSSVIAWNKDTGEPLSPVLSWQDVRASEALKPLKMYEADIHSRSGLVLSPHYGASKIHWLQSQFANSTNAIFTPLVSYLIRVLIGRGVPVCDESNAGRTQLWNLTARKWDCTLAEYFKVNLGSVPEVKPTDYVYGTLIGVGAPEVYLRCVMGDQNAALLGATLPKKQQILINCGTGAFVLVNRAAETKPAKKLLNSLVYSNDSEIRFLVEGTVNGAGAALSWFAAKDEVSTLGGEAWLFKQLPRWLTEIQDPHGVFVNTIGGLGSPFWNANLESTFIGKSNSVEEKAVAIVESIVFLLCINLELMSQSLARPQGIAITGGLSRLDGLCQKLADLSGLTCSRLSQRETTLLGVGVAVSNAKISPADQYNAVFKPQKNSSLERRFQRFKGELESK